VHLPSKFKLKSTILLATPLLFLTPLPTLAQPGQLEEITVTAQRRESNLQETPMSIQAFTAETLELSGLEQGRDLGIMVPNVVLNPAGGGGPGGSSLYIRGLPGVGIYIDGVWQGGASFLQSNFVELESIEVLRGPQGTLFGRNTNGGAVNIKTKGPGDEFAFMGSMTVGEFNRRDASFSVDLPISDTLKSKFTAARYFNDGFLESQTVDRSFGGQDDTIFRADVLWEPTDNFSLRGTFTDEQKASSDARIVRFTNLQHPRYLGYNVLAGNPDFITPEVEAAIGLPPKQLANDRFTPETHEPGFPGGELGQWQTRSNTANAGSTRDLQYATLTANWDINENLSLKAITSKWEQEQRQVTDFDGSEFSITTDDYYTDQENTTIEIQLSGSFMDDRLTFIGGYYNFEQESKQRFYRWAMQEFSNPGTSGGGNDDVAAIDYVKAYGAFVGNPSLVGFRPLTFISSDALTGNDDEDKAFFGNLTYSFTDKLDVTVGARRTSDSGQAATYTETGAFRPATDQSPLQGNPFSGFVDSITKDPDLGNINTYKFAASYQVNDDIFVYGSWGEGFTSGGVTISPNFPDPIILDPEIIETTEIGLRSDWLDGSLRFNANYFQSEWVGLRVPILPDDPNNPGQKLPFPVNTSEGSAEADGWEFELVYAATDNLLITAGLGILDANYVSIGDPDPSGVNGIQPGSPFAYAPETSASLSVQYDRPLSNGASLLFVANYGWMDEYVRDPANQRTPKDANGNTIFEPDYGILNARVRYSPPGAEWNLEVWGRNLTDEFYINGGFDTRTVWGYDFSVIGVAREVGLSLGFQF
jgi:iron complex outermembrane receptor protein